MALALTPRLLRRGLELFAIISLAGVVVVLAVYGENVQAVVRGLLHLQWWWMVLGLGLASMDWLGGGTRLWVVARHVHPGVRLKDMIIAGGMSAWAAYLTPFQSGAGPTMMWVMRRAGVRLPEAMTSTFMTFVATVVFFAIAGPLAIYLGAGKSLAQHNVVLGITYYGLFRTSLTIFGILGVVMLVAMVFPGWRVGWSAGATASRRASSSCARGSTGRTSAWSHSATRRGGWRCFGPCFSRRRRTPISCSRDTSRCARSVFPPTSSTSSCSKRSSPSFSTSRRRQGRPDSPSFFPRRSCRSMSGPRSCRCTRSSGGSSTATRP